MEDNCGFSELDLCKRCILVYIRWRGKEGQWLEQYGDESRCSASSIESLSECRLSSEHVEFTSTEIITREYRNNITLYLVCASICMNWYLSNSNISHIMSSSSKHLPSHLTASLLVHRPRNQNPIPDPSPYPSPLAWSFINFPTKSRLFCVSGPKAPYH